MELRAAACRNLQHARVRQAVLISTPPQARSAILSGQKTEKWNTMASRAVKPGYRAHFTPPSPWKPSDGSAWRVATNPAVEGRVHLCPGSRVGRQKETFFFSFLPFWKQNPTVQFCTLAHMEAEWKSDWTKHKWCRSEDNLPLCMFTFNETCHSHLSIAVRSHLLAQCAPFVCSIRPIVCCKPTAIWTEDSHRFAFMRTEELIPAFYFISAQAQIAITCPFFMQPNGINAHFIEP